jgi:hypothetical protein
MLSAGSQKTPRVSAQLKSCCCCQVDNQPPYMPPQTLGRSFRSCTTTVTSSAVNGKECEYVRTPPPPPPPRDVTSSEVTSPDAVPGCCSRATSSKTGQQDPRKQTSKNSVGLRSLRVWRPSFATTNRKGIRVPPTEWSGLASNARPHRPTY